MCAPLSGCANAFAQPSACVAAAHLLARLLILLCSCNALRDCVWPIQTYAHDHAWQLRFQSNVQTIIKAVFCDVC